MPESLHVTFYNTDFKIGLLSYEKNALVLSSNHPLLCKKVDKIQQHST